MADEEEDSSFLSGIKSRLAKAPCVRDSIISGITGGFFVGFAAFIFTSNSRRGYNWGFGSSIALLQFQYFGCKFKQLEQERIQKALKEGIRQHILTEGTAQADQNIESKALTETEGHVPLDELEEFERRAQAAVARRAQEAAAAAASGAPSTPSPVTPAPTTPPAAAACDCS